MATVRAGRIAAMSVGASLTLVACMSGGGPRTGTGPSPIASPGPASLRIVFVLGEPTILYTAASDGSDAHALTDFGVEDPDWSPDGSMIAFDSEYADRSHIFTINADGTGLRQVTRGRGFEGHPSWSPDGKWFAVDRQFVHGPAGLFVASVPDGSMTRITTNPYEDGVDASPQYSQDGTRIVFIRSRPGGSAVWVANADGSQAHRITPWKMIAGHPWWSPDGSRIVFYDGGGSVSYGAGDSHIFVVNADGTALTQLTQGDNEADFHPSWSPDGRAILFTRYAFAPQSELFALYTMEPDGSRASLLYKSPAGDLNDASFAPLEA
jgi:Tol biopolymer transport system component